MNMLKRKYHALSDRVGATTDALEEIPMARRPKRVWPSALLPGTLQRSATTHTQCVRGTDFSCTSEWRKTACALASQKQAAAWW